MFKQIIPTFEKKPTIQEYVTENKIDTTTYLQDEFLMDECQKFTKTMMEMGMGVNRICELVKDYQKKYIYLHNECPDLAKKYTMEMWFKTMNK